MRGANEVTARGVPMQATLKQRPAPSDPQPMKLSPRARAVVAAWAVGIVLLLAAVWAALSYTSSQLLTRSAEQTALKYARGIMEQLPELRLLFDQRRAGADLLHELKHVRAMGDVFRFKFFDRDGQLLLTSDDLDQPDPLAATAAAAVAAAATANPDASSITHRAGNLTVRDIALGGHNAIETKSGAGKANRPPVYTQAYVPVVADGRVIGVVEVYVDSTALASRIHAAFLDVALIVGGALLVVASGCAAHWWHREREKDSVEQRMRYLAEHDVLSGALNRSSFNDALNQAVLRHENGGPAFAVLCIDLDRFKDINDTHGHATGDAVLREATRRLQGVVRHGDVLARLGGDEFAILQNAVADSDSVQKLAERVVQAMAEPLSVSGRRMSCGASVGAARFGVDARSVDDLMHKADVAMYRAKTDGRGRFSFYDGELDRQLEDKRDLGRDLRAASSDDGRSESMTQFGRKHGLSMHYQAIHAADGTTLLGYEALMRWSHPTRGMVPPSVFIPVAEESGQIETLGRFALDRACKEAAGWPAPLSVSVNLSAAQFRGQADLVQVVAAALDRTGLPANRLVLEITESLLMNDTDAVVATLTKLSALGVGIAMDDFGTGYSSLAYLWRFPFDKVKIDRAFTQGLGVDPKVDLVVRSIVSLAHSLSMRVNAEGVETALQMSLLQSIGCDELQGFLLSRPAAPETLTHAGAVGIVNMAPSGSGASVEPA